MYFCWILKKVKRSHLGVTLYSFSSEYTNEKLSTIVELDYNGYIACEYEGHHFTDELDTAEQLKRYEQENFRIIRKII